MPRPPRPPRTTRKSADAARERTRQPRRGTGSPAAGAPGRVRETAASGYGGRGNRGTPREQWVAAGEFKARCLELMDRVRDRREQVVITKRGVPVARLVPYDEKPPSVLGHMRGTVLWSGDLISPIDAEWDACAGDQED